MSKVHGIVSIEASVNESIGLGAMAMVASFGRACIDPYVCGGAGKSLTLDVSRSDVDCAVVDVSVDVVCGKASLAFVKCHCVSVPSSGVSLLGGAWVALWVPLGYCCWGVVLVVLVFLVLVVFVVLDYDFD